jgi:acyl-[acyl-carrier-protein] desaturase
MTMRHHHAYSEFVTVFSSSNEMMLAFQYMMKAKIVMPALERIGEKISTALNSFLIRHKNWGLYRSRLC